VLIFSLTQGCEIRSNLSLIPPNPNVYIMSRLPCSAVDFVLFVLIQVMAFLTYLTTYLTSYLTGLTQNLIVCSEPINQNACQAGIRDAVIRDWLNGKIRDTISRDHSLSAGAVTNIVNEWRNALSFPVADALRILGTILRKSGITASQCASGFRLARIVKELGVDEEA
jgi:hypothetical protein